MTDCAGWCAWIAGCFSDRRTKPDPALGDILDKTSKKQYCFQFRLDIQSKPAIVSISI